MTRSVLLLALVIVAAIAAVWVLAFSPRGGAGLFTEDPALESSEAAVIDGVGAASLVAPAAEAEGRSALTVQATIEEESDAPAPGSLRTIRLGVFDRRSGLPMGGVDVVHSVLSLDGARLGRRKTTFRTNDRGSADLEVEPGGTLRMRVPHYGKWSYDVPRDVEDGEMTAFLNAHATLHGRVAEAKGGSVVLIRQRGAGVTPDLREHSVAVGPDGRWEASNLEILQGQAFAPDIEVLLRWARGARPLAVGLTLQPGDRREIMDPAEGIEPWSIRLLYADGAPLNGRASVSVMERAGPDVRVESKEKTNTDGWVTLDGVAPGRWYLLLEDDGRSLGLEATREVGKSDLTITLGGVGRVEGQIVSASGSPAEGLHVHLSGADASGDIVTSSKNGKFRFDLVPVHARPTLTVTDTLQAMGPGRNVVTTSRTYFRKTLDGAASSEWPSALAELVAVPGFEELEVRLEVDVSGTGRPRRGQDGWSIEIR